MGIIGKKIKKELEKHIEERRVAVNNIEGADCVHGFELFAKHICDQINSDIINNYAELEGIKESIFFDAYKDEIHPECLNQIEFLRKKLKKLVKFNLER